MNNTKKQKEHDCLNDVAEHCKSGDRLERKIARILSSEAALAESESPDFVFWIKGRERKAVLGVEHFSAHHFSEQYKDGKTVGTNQYSWDDELKRYRVHDEPIIPKEKEKCIKAAIEKTTVNMFNAKYHMLCKALEQGLYNHSKKIDDYKKNIRDRLGAGVDIEIAFMIDISTEFDSCIVYNGKEGRITKTFVPMFRDIVDILSQIDSAKVDYIFIRFNKLGTINKHDVIVLRTNNIEQQLMKKKITVYEYVGEDFRIIRRDKNIVTKCLVTYDRCEKKVTGRVSCAVKRMTDFYIDVYKAYMWAMHYKNNGISFVTTLPVCQLIELFDGILDGSKWISHKQLQYIYDCNREIIDSRCEVLRRRLEIDDKKCYLIVLS